MLVSVNTRWSGNRSIAHKASTLEQIEAKLDDNVVLIAQNLRNFPRYPSEAGYWSVQGVCWGLRG